MGRVKDVMKLIKGVEVNSRYDAGMDQIKEIHRKSPGHLDAICNGFRFRYIQGQKAAKAEARKR